MDREAKSSILDDLKADSVIVSDDGEGEQSGELMAPVQARPVAPAPEPDGSDPFELEFERDTRPAGPAPEPARRADHSAAGNGDERDRRSAPETGHKRAATRASNARIRATVSFVELALTGIHSTLSALTKNEIWDIDESETKELAEAIGEVQAHYGFALDPKTEAWLKLLAVAGKVYGTRIGGMIAMKRLEIELAKIRAQTPQQEDDGENAPTPQAPIMADPNRFSARPGFVSLTEATNPSQIYPRGHAGANS